MLNKFILNKIIPFKSYVNNIYVIYYTTTIDTTKRVPNIFLCKLNAKILDIKYLTLRRQRYD